MPLVVDKLNDLLARERGLAEATKSFIDEILYTDPDIADETEDALQTASWSCSGLYRRITQLQGTPNLEADNLVQKVDDAPDVKSKIEILNRAHKKCFDTIKKLLRQEDLDDATRGFLDDMLRAHQDALNWCNSILSEWKVDI